MDNDAYLRTLDALSPSRRMVFDALTSLGSATDDDLSRAVGRSRSRVVPRRTDLMRMGLVRETGQALSEAGRPTAVWQAVPPEDVERLKEQAEDKGPRRLSVKRWPLDERIAVARVLLRDRPVYNAIVHPDDEQGGRRARARARQAMEKDQRERTTEIKRRAADGEELVNVLKAKDHLKRAIDVVRSIGFILEDERDRDEAREPIVIPEWAWSEVVELLEELLSVSEQTFDRAAEHLGLEPRSSMLVLDGAGPQEAARPAKPVGPYDPSEADDLAASADGPRQPRT
jgi:predicted transcriptional regulator